MLSEFVALSNQMAVLARFDISHASRGYFPLVAFTTEILNLDLLLCTGCRTQTIYMHLKFMRVMRRYIENCGMRVQCVRRRLPQSCY